MPSTNFKTPLIQGRANGRKVTRIKQEKNATNTTYGRKE